MKGANPARVEWQEHDGTVEVGSSKQPSRLLDFSGFHFSSVRCRNRGGSVVIKVVAGQDARQQTRSRILMQYLLMIYSSESQWPDMTPADQERGVAAYQAYTEALKQAGVLKGSNRLHQSSTATTVRVADGRSQVLDGPFIDSKEQLAGYFLIDVPDLDVAIAWAARCPGASHGVIEVRPSFCCVE
jgi:hypothetical protein